MHTPYILFWKEVDAVALAQLKMEGRKPVHRTCGAFTFVFFPPDQERFLSELNDRIHIEGDNLWFEEGFMVSYPDRYMPVVRNKLALFEKPSITLDGAFSRVQVIDGTLKIDGSATYLQTLSYFQKDAAFALTNHYDLLEKYLQTSGTPLTVSDDFFASHLFQNTQAFFMFMGTQWKEISTFDSLDTLRFDGDLNISIQNKFDDTEFCALPRKDRLDILNNRMLHAINEYCDWAQASEIAHELTSGRDSRTSLALFKSHQSKNLKIRTYGHLHSTDQVISDYICGTYGLEKSVSQPTNTGFVFRYANLLNWSRGAKWHIALFRLIGKIGTFDPTVLVANGYLGNVAVDIGNVRKHFIEKESTPLSQQYYERLYARYSQEIDNLKSVYGDSFAARIFNLKFNTTNKISGPGARLHSFSYCIFESDLFYLSYMMEEETSAVNHSIHYELMDRTDPFLANSIPFESRKSFPRSEYTYQVQEFKNSSRISGYSDFCKKNISEIVKHIRLNLSALPFLDESYLSEVESTPPQDINTMTVYKIFGILGSLDFKGKPLNEYTELGEGNDEDPYTIDFFRTLYLDREIHASGLSAMVYEQNITYRSFPKLEDNEKLIVRIAALPIANTAVADVQKNVDGYTVRLSLEPGSGYRIVHFAYNHASRKKRELYRTHVVYQEPQSPTKPSASQTSIAQTKQRLEIGKRNFSKKLLPISAKRWILSKFGPS